MLLYATGVTPTAAKPFPPLPPPTDTTASVLVLNNDRFQYSSVYDDQNWCLISGNNVLTILADGAYRTTDYAGSDLTPYAAAVDVPSSRVFVKAYSTSRGIAILDIWEWQGKTPVLTRVKALDLDKTWATQTYALQVEAGIVYVDCGRMTYTTEGVFIAKNPTVGDGRGLSFHPTDRTKAVRCSAWTGVNGSTKIYSNVWTFYVFNKGVADRLAHLEVPGLLAWRDKVQEVVRALAPTGFAVGFTTPAGQAAPAEAQPAWDGAFEHVVTETVSVEPGTYLETSLLHDGLLMLKAALAIGRFASAPDSASYDETVTTTRYATSILELVGDKGREALLEKWGLLPQPAQEPA